MKNTFKKILALLLSFILISFAYPVSVSAASGPVPGKVVLTKATPKSYHSVNLTWKKTSNCSKYMIYYRESGAKSWKRIASVPASATSYLHKSSKKYPVLVGKKYDYTIRGYHSRSRKTGPLHNLLSVRTKPNRPQLTGAKLQKNGIVTVSWKASGGADHYIIYRKTPGTSWKKSGTVSSGVLTYTDKHPVKGKTNTYTVKAGHKSSKTYSSYSTKGISISVPAAQKPNPDQTDLYKKQVLTLVNKERSKRGLPALTTTPQMEKAASIRAKELPNHFYHTRPDGSLFFTALYEAGATFYTAGENIAAYQSSPAAVVDAWMKSTGHRTNILSPEYGKIGVGYYKTPNGSPYWVQLFTN